MKLKAFTLTELLIALAVLGLLIAILMPIISNLLPDQNALMAKRAYYAAQTIVSDLINDEACYPDHTQSDYIDPVTGESDQRVGFDDGYGYADCVKWGGVENTDSIDAEDSASKFVTLFKNKLDINPNNDEGAVFETRDGVRWAIDAGFTANDPDSMARITVDVNGGENPNCSQSANANATLKTGESCEARTDDFDIFVIDVYADGRMEIEDQWAIEAVDINKDVTSVDANNPNAQAPNPEDHEEEPEGD